MSNIRRWMKQSIVLICNGIPHTIYYIWHYKCQEIFTLQLGKYHMLNDSTFVKKTHIYVDT